MIKCFSLPLMSTTDFAHLTTVVRDRDSLFVAWARGRQQEERRRLALLQGLQAQPDPSEAADISAPITAWAEGHARDKRRQANAIAQLRRG
jgi:hypothetical protein